MAVSRSAVAAGIWRLGQKANVECSMLNDRETRSPRFHSTFNTEHSTFNICRPDDATKAVRDRETPEQAAAGNEATCI
jgi:hypothetical protein